MSAFVFDLQRYTTNYNKNSWVAGTYLDDNITNYAGGATVYGYSGNDYIYNSTYGDYKINYSYGYVTIDGGDGDDTIRSYDPYVSINGGAGNDYISIYSGSYAGVITVKGGTGNDIVIGDSATGGSGVLYQYAYGDGYDSILNYNSHDTISISGASSWSSIISGSNVIVSVPGSGAMTLVGASDKTLNIYPTVSPVINNTYSYVPINGTSGNDSIVNSGYYVTINSGYGNDTIYNGYVNYVSVNSGEGDDSISNYSAWYSTVNAGDGNDTIVVPYRAYYNSLNGGAGSDKISLGSGNGNGYSGGNTVVGGTGNDTIWGNPDSAFGNVYRYYYGDGYDSILNYSSQDTVSIGGSYYYTRSTVGSDVVISLLSGGAMTLNGASNKTVNITGGIPTIISSVMTNTVKNIYVNGTSGKNTIDNLAGGVTIKAGGGDDSIYNSTSSYYTINNSWGYVTIDGEGGNDTIFSNDPYVSINGGAGDDSIKVVSGSSYRGITINGGVGNDTIYGSSLGGGVLYQYKYGDGSDVIYNSKAGDTISISGASGWSSMTSGNNVLLTVANSGVITLIGAKNNMPDVYPKTIKSDINNYTDNTLISGTSSADTINNYGDRVTVKANGGNDKIYNNKGDYASIVAGNGDDSIYGNNDYTTVSGGAGKDTITGNHWRSKLFGNGDNDLISITTYWYNTIDGGSGNDTICAGGSEHSINGGAGSDRISLSGNKLTVKGGTGNDTIYGDTATSHLYQYGAGDGSDIIYNWSSSDSLTITGGRSWSSVTNNNNVLINVANSGTISLMGAKGKTINVYPTSTPSPSVPLVPSSNVTAQDVIKKFMKSLDTTNYSGTAAVNQAVSVASGGYFRNVQAVIDSMINDRNNSTDGNSFLQNYCGIILDNDDTGAISGKDAGGSTYLKTASGIVPESGSVNNFTGSSFSTNGLNIRLANCTGGSNFYDMSYGNLTNSTQRYIWQAFQTWWAGGALNLIANSYGSNYGFNSSSSATVKDMQFGFVNENSGVMATTWYWWNGNGKSTRLAMSVNMHNYNSLVIGDSDGKRSGSSFYLDRVLSHEFTHAVMAANVNYFCDLPMFVSEGTAELTHGTDDDRKDEILALANNTSNLRYALNNDCYNSYAGGYMFLRYLAKQGSEHYPTANSSGYSSSNMAVSGNNADKGNSTVKGSLLTLGKSFEDELVDLTEYSSKVKKVDATALSKGIMIIGNQKANSISAGAGADTLSGNTGDDTLTGNDGNDLIRGDSGNDLINGNAGNDSINGGTGDDTLTGGDGKDVFIYGANGGSDVITDYTQSKDKIKLLEENVSITAVNVSGNDVMLSVGAQGSITVKNGKGKKITVIDGKGKSVTKKYSDSVKTLTVTNDMTSPVTVKSSVNVIDASNRSVSVKIKGNKLDNTILGGSKKDSLYGEAGNDSVIGNDGNDKLYGGKGDDTLWGGSGNDSLWGNDGADTFIYNSGEGKDVIFGFDKNDTLTLDSLDFKASYSKKNKAVALKFDSGSVTLQDFTAKTFHINDDIYKISGSKFKKQ